MKSFSKIFTFRVHLLTRSCLKEENLLNLKLAINILYLLTTGSFLASIGDGFDVSLENQNVVNMCVLVIIIEIMFKINVNLKKKLPVFIILTELGEEEELQVKIYDRIIEEGAGSQSLVIIESNGDGSSLTLGILTQVL